MYSERVVEIIEKSYNLEEDAEGLIAAFIEEDPKHPRGHFLKAARLYWLQYYAGYDVELSAEFERAAMDALAVAKRFNSNNKRDEDALFFLGMVELNLARYYVDRERWVSAFFKARSGMKHLRRVLRLNPDYHDAKQPFGLANCYLADAPSFLKVFARLVRFRGDYSEGMRLLRESKRLGYYTRYESSLYIADVSWAVQQDAAIAQVEIQELVDRFPRNVFFHLNLAILEEKQGDREAAIERLRHLVTMPELDDFLDLYVEAYLKLGYFINLNGEHEEALDYIERGLEALGERENALSLVSMAMFLKGSVLCDLRRMDDGLNVLRSIKREWHPALFGRAQEKIKEMEASKRSAEEL